MLGAFSSTITKESKKKAWTQIIECVNQVKPLNPPRLKDDVKKKWNNVSGDAKKAIDKHKAAISGTGTWVIKLSNITYISSSIAICNYYMEKVLHF